MAGCARCEQGDPLSEPEREHQQDDFINEPCIEHDSINLATTNQPYIETRRFLQGVNERCDLSRNEFHVFRTLRKFSSGKDVIGNYIPEYTDSCISCSRVVGVPNGNAPRRAAAPVPWATGRSCLPKMLIAAL